MFLVSVGIGALLFSLQIAGYWGIRDGSAEVVVFLPVLVTITFVMALPIAGLLVIVGAVLCRPLRAKPRWINRTVLAGAALGP